MIGHEELMKLRPKESPSLFDQRDPFVYLGPAGGCGIGITGYTEYVLYYPQENSMPFGLGKWIPQRQDLETSYPAIPGQWVIPPDLPNNPSDVFMAVKMARKDPQARGQLSFERAALLKMDPLFTTQDRHRPIKLLGYGVEGEGNPYLVEEYVNPQFEPLADRLLKNGGVLGQREALHIILGICSILDKVHSVDIIHNDIIIQNIFWSPPLISTRLIDWGNSSDQQLPLTRGGTSYGHDRKKLGELLFRCLTGQAIDESKSIAPDRKSIPEILWQPIHPLVRHIIERACYLTSDNYDPYAAKATSEMYKDLAKALHTVWQLEKSLI